MPVHSVNCSKVSCSWSASCSRIELNRVTVSPSKLPYSSKSAQSAALVVPPSSSPPPLPPPPPPPPRSSAPPQADRTSARAAAPAASVPVRGCLRIFIEFLHAVVGRAHAGSAPASNQPFLSVFCKDLQRRRW